MNQSEIYNYNDYEIQRRVMVSRKDWHGVADAAMDLREMEAEKKHEQG